MRSCQCITEWVHSRIFRHILEECMTIQISYILQLSLHTVWQLTSPCERKQFLYLFPWGLGKLFLMLFFVGFLHYSIGAGNVLCCLSFWSCIFWNKALLWETQPRGQQPLEHQGSAKWERQFSLLFPGHVYWVWLFLHSSSMPYSRWIFKCWSDLLTLYLKYAPTICAPLCMLRQYILFWKCFNSIVYMCCMSGLWRVEGLVEDSTPLTFTDGTAQEYCMWMDSSLYPSFQHCVNLCKYYNVIQNVSFQKPHWHNLLQVHGIGVVSAWCRCSKRTISL